MQTSSDDVLKLTERITECMYHLAHEESKLVHDPMNLPFIYLKTMMRRLLVELDDEFKTIASGASWHVPAIYELRSSRTAPLPWLEVNQDASVVIYKMFAGNSRVIATNLNKDQADALIQFGTSPRRD